MQKLIVLLALLFFPALAYAQGFGSPNGVGFPSNGSGSGGGLTSPVGISDGGTGQTTKAAGFNALSPLTTQGDILYGGASGAGTRLAKGTALQILRTNAGATAPEWATPAWQIGDGGTGLSSFTGGDTLYYASGTLLSKLAKGTAGQFYQMNSGATAPQWSSMSGDATMAAGGATTLATVNSNVGSFTNSSITVNAKGLVTAASSGAAAMTNPLTTTGDTIYSSSGTTAARLAIGKYDQQYSPSLGGVPAWSDRPVAPSVTTSDLKSTAWSRISTPGSTTILGVGMTAAAAAGTATQSTDSTGSYLNCATAATNTNRSGWESNTSGIQRQLAPTLWIKIKTGAAGDLLVQRTWIGATSSFNNLQQNDTQSTTQYAACRASTSASDANWKFCTNDGSGTSTDTDTGVAIAADTTYTFCFIYGPSSISCYINGVLCATNTTDLPSASTTLFPLATTTTLENVAKNIKISSFIYSML